MISLSAIAFYIWQTSLVTNKSIPTTINEFFKQLLSQTTVLIYIAVFGVLAICLLVSILARMYFGVDIGNVIRKHDRPLPKIFSFLLALFFLAGVASFALWALYEYGLM